MFFYYKNQPPGARKIIRLLQRFFIKIVASWLCVLLAFQAVGWLFAWQTARWEVRLTASQAHGSEQQFAYARADFEAQKVHDDEIRINGFLYDIRKMSIEGDSVRFWAEIDKKETGLFVFLDQMLSAKKQQPAASAFVLIAFWLDTKYLATAQPDWQLPGEPALAPLFFHTRLPYGPFEAAVPVPPPETNVHC